MTQGVRRRGVRQSGIRSTASPPGPNLAAPTSWGMSARPPSTAWRWRAGRAVPMMDSSRPPGISGLTGMKVRPAREQARNIAMDSAVVSDSRITRAPVSMPSSASAAV